MLNRNALTRRRSDHLAQGELAQTRTEGALRRKGWKPIEVVRSGRPVVRTGSLDEEFNRTSTPDFPVVDLLHRRPVAMADAGVLGNLLELAFLGKDVGSELEAALGRAGGVESDWQPQFFAEDLFVDEVLAKCLSVRREGREYKINRSFARRALVRPPSDLLTIRFRQGIQRELSHDAGIRRRAEDLHRSLTDLFALFKALRNDPRLNAAGFRIDILRHACAVVGLMGDGFRSAGSGLRRLHEAGEAIRAGRPFGLLQALLEFEGRHTTLGLTVAFGADGRLRELTVLDCAEASSNIFFRNPLQRLCDRIRFLWLGVRLDRAEIIDRTIMAVFLEVAPMIRSLLLVLLHLELHLASVSFSEVAADAGLQTCLAEVEEEPERVTLTGLFNPLLIGDGQRPVPCTLDVVGPPSINVVTGPNSGGKTRLLQAVGIAQMLGQSGFFTPCAGARLMLSRGLHVSLVDRGSADQAEGRLGTELVRIRRLFETASGRSLVLLDELCSGTNPSEAIEIVSMVLKLLRRIEPVAFVSTHFLDFALSLEGSPPVDRLNFLQVEVDGELRSTYQFVPGVARTSMAAGTAHRLGVTFDELAALVSTQGT